MLRLYDSLRKEVLALKPVRGKTFHIYACGPTVYKDVHIGNLRTFAETDLLRRYLEYRGYKVKLVMNITDVGHALQDEDRGEDKIEKAAEEEGKTPKEVARFYEKKFFGDMDALNMKKAWKYPRATEHIKEMTALVQTLIDKKKAYLTDKGDVYYDVSSFEEYGKLSGNTVGNLVAGARVEVAEDKRHPADFALWIRDPDHVLQWNTPWGAGYPGWHLECSAMAGRYLGDTLDLHIGGEDLKFPHHECEIAQSEGATGKEFCRHWLHVKYLEVEGQKMSKSLGNYYTLGDLLEKGHTPQAVRYLLLSAHYRQPLNFTFDGLDASEKTVRGLAELEARLGKDADHLGLPENDAWLVGAEKRFNDAMDDDLNVSAALAVLHDFKKEMNRLMDKGALGKKQGKAAKELLKAWMEDVFGIDLKLPKNRVSKDIQVLVEQRDRARGAKDWAESDRLRDEIEKLGWKVEDGPEGTQVRKK